MGLLQTCNGTLPSKVNKLIGYSKVMVSKVKVIMGHIIMSTNKTQKVMVSKAKIIMDHIIMRNLGAKASHILGHVL